uniref:Glycosyltransferase family 92 protein n=1 Tax=Toxocara canis TaxID=6265 RepID=A0A183V015_TOXCA
LKNSIDISLPEICDIPNVFFYCSFDADTVVILFNAHRDFINADVSIRCFANSATNSSGALATIRYSSWASYNCKWNTYIAECTTLPNMILLRIATYDSKSRSHEPRLVEIPFKHDVKMKNDVVSCVSPLFFFERWQMLFAFVEVYRFFGVSKQSIYVGSILTNIMRILQKYEEHGSVELIPWTMLLYDGPLDGDDPNRELSWRNQETAMNECFFRYKESASFILFLDVDEILIPTSSSYFNDFRVLTEGTAIASFTFEKFYTKTLTNIIPSSYSLSKLLLGSTLDPFMKGEGKSIVIPSKVSSMWIHWPPKKSIAEGYHHVNLNSTNNFFFHPRYWQYVFRNPRTTMQPLFDERSETLRLRQRLAWSKLVEVEKSFIDFVKAEDLLDIYSKLDVAIIYDSMFEACFTSVIDQQLEARRDYCPTSTECYIPRIYGVECTVAQSSFQVNELKNRVIYTIARKTFKNVNNGCFHV